MLRRIGYFLIPSLFVLLAMTAYGQDTSSEPNLDTSGTPPTDNSHTVKVNAQERKQNVQERRVVVKENIQNRREELKEKRASFSANLKERREEARDLFKERRESLKAKLETFKDERKKALAERIDAKMKAINERRTEHMVKVLEKLSDIAGRLEEKISQAEEEGKDVAAARTAIETANDAIATAQSAVSSQAGKEYVATVSDELNVKSNFGQVMSQLQADLRAAHKTVVDAKQAVMNAAKEVKLLKGEKVEPTVTPDASGDNAE